MELLTITILKLILTNYSLGLGASNSYFDADSNQTLYSLDYVDPQLLFLERIITNPCIL